MYKQYKFCECRHCNLNRANGALILLQLHTKVNPMNLFHMIAIMAAAELVDISRHSELSEDEIIDYFFSSIKGEYDSLKRDYEKQVGTAKKDVDKQLNEIDKKLSHDFNFIDLMKGNK